MIPLDVEQAGQKYESPQAHQVSDFTSDLMMFTYNTGPLIIHSALCVCIPTACGVFRFRGRKNWGEEFLRIPAVLMIAANAECHLVSRGGSAAARLMLIQGWTWTAGLQSSMRLVLLVHFDLF